jgi:hypothetical protein
MAGRQQMAALAQALPHMPELTALLLRNNDIDNWALQVLVEASIEHSSCNITCLDLGYNGLGPEACLTLVPLLHRPPRANNNAVADAPGVPLKRAISTTAGMEPRRASCTGVAPLVQSPGLAQLVGSGTPDHSLLLQLVLAGNVVGDAGAEVICKLVATGLPSADAPCHLGFIVCKPPPTLKV